MNITFVLPEGLQLGGVTTWSLKMAQQLSAVGTSVVLIDHQPIESSLYAQPEAAKIVFCKGNHPDHFTERDVEQHFAAYHSVLPATIIPNWSAGTYAICAAMSKESSNAFRLIGVAHGEGEHYNQWLTYYEPIIHKFIAVSHEIANTLAQRMPHRTDDIIYRSCPVEVPSGLHRTYSLQPQPIRLAYVGRLTHEEKCVFHLLTLAEALDQLQVNFMLRIVGEGKHQGELIERIRQITSAVQKKIIVEHAIPHQEISRVWLSSDICVLVSKHEGTSISMLEAMAHGCVPVVTNVSGTRQAIEPGNNGFFVKVGDIKAMAQTISLLERERNRLPFLGQNAYDTVARRFSYTEYVDWFIDFANDVWQMSPRRWPANRPLLWTPLPDNLSNSKKAPFVFATFIQSLKRLKHRMSKNGRC